MLLGAACCHVAVTRLKTLHQLLVQHTVLEIDTRKIHMYFVASVFYEITCIPSNTEKPPTDSNVGLCVLIYDD